MDVQSLYVDSGSRDERPLPPIPGLERSSGAGDIPHSTNQEASPRTSIQRQRSINSVQSGGGAKAIPRSYVADPASVLGADSPSSTAAYLDTKSAHPARSPSKDSSSSRDDTPLVAGSPSNSTGNAPRGLPAGRVAEAGGGSPSGILASQVNPPDRNNRSHQRERSSGSDPTRDSPNLSRTVSQIRREQQRPGRAHMEQTQYILPKWEADASAVLCPICRTQFSFFVRKHHCRKCGRVVCGNCSPHRIIIPYQFIVHPPPSEGTSSTTNRRPTLDNGRSGSATVVENFGGGERVRLCNPCVPDPNIAPPQAVQPGNGQYRPGQQGHARSVSTTGTSTTTQPRSTTQNSPTPPPFYTQRRPRQPSTLNPYNANTASYSERSNRLSRAEELHSRSRSSTVGTNRDPSSMGESASSMSSYIPPQAPPADPSPRIADNDQCWTCLRELPSRSLPNWEDLRQAHVSKCIAEAERRAQGGSPSPSPSPALVTTISQPSSNYRPDRAESSRSSQTAPPISDPLPATSAAERERRHAAVIHAALASATPIRQVGTFPYLATEKDCIDDAECTICLEEFEVGVRMSRLECFCRFHEKCIREWFESRPGQCPIHQHGAGY